MSETEAERARAGVPAAFAAYCVWGVSPLVFKQIDTVPAPEIMAHRIVWALAAVALLVAVRGQWSHAYALLRDRRRLGIFALSGLAIAVNWLTFVYAVTSGQALYASMGYYMFPLVSLLLGAAFLRERLNRRQAAAVVLVVTGVAVVGVGIGHLPWISLTLAVSFALYGFLRKIAPAESMVGLFLETLLMAPPMAAFLVWLEATGAGAFGHDGFKVSALLVLTGPAFTALPLLLFAFAARRLKLATVGLMQYLNPTIQFLIAVLVFREPFAAGHLVAFLFIWSGLAVYALDPTVLLRRRVPGRR